MVRPRKRQSPPSNARADGEDGNKSSELDVNAIVSFNVRALRERRNWTQQYVAQKLSMLTGHVLPQASISAMEGGYEGDRRRRFDAHELYLLALVFDVPITYLFMPPPGRDMDLLADSGRPVPELYRTLLGQEWELDEMDERLTALKVRHPDEADRILVAMYGDPDKAQLNWHEHYRSWRKKRLKALAKEYGDELDDVAEKLGKFAERISMLGPEGYLSSIAHKRGEPVEMNQPKRPEDVTDEEVRAYLADSVARRAATESAPEQEV